MFVPVMAIVDVIINNIEGIKVMLIYELAIVEDRGTYWLVNGVTKNSFDNLANREEKYLKLSYMVYKLIYDAIAEGKQVRISKSLQTDEVLPGEIQILEKQVDDLEYAKQSFISKIRSYVTPELSKIAGYTLYNFIELNNKLSAEGYFIHNGNREEKYIEIIESQNEELIETLEDYLAMKDEMDRVCSLKTKINIVTNNIKKASTVQEMQTLSDEFIASIYTNE